MGPLLEQLLEIDKDTIWFHKMLFNPTCCSCDPNISTSVTKEQKVNCLEAWFQNTKFCKTMRIDSLVKKNKLTLEPNLFIYYKPEFVQHMLWLIICLEDTISKNPLQQNSLYEAVQVKGAKLYAPNIETSHQGIVSGLLLFKALQHLPKEENIERGLGLILLSAELSEKDYKQILKGFIQENPKTFSKKDYFIVQDFGNKHGTLIAIQEKPKLSLKIEVTEENYHPDHDIKPNAFESAAHFIAHLPIIKKHYPTKDSNFFPDCLTITPSFDRDLWYDYSCKNHASFYKNACFAFHLDIGLVSKISPTQIIQKLQHIAYKIEKKNQCKIIMTCESSPNEIIRTSPLAPTVQVLQKAFSQECQIKTNVISAGDSIIARTLRNLGFPAVSWGIQSGERLNKYECITLQQQAAQTRIFARMLYSFKTFYSKNLIEVSKNNKQKITPSEMRVAKLLSTGLSNDEICAQLNVSLNTLRSHLKQLYRKTQTRGRKELARLCMTL